MPSGAADPEGRFSFSTVEPGPTEAGRARFISVVVFARGLLNRLFTRIYLPEDQEALERDPLLSSVPADRRETLIARREQDGSLRFARGCVDGPVVRGDRVAWSTLMTAHGREGA